jgi:hypothetical protein
MLHLPLIAERDETWSLGRRQRRKNNDIGRNYYVVITRVEEIFVSRSIPMMTSFERRRHPLMKQMRTHDGIVSMRFAPLEVYGQSSRRQSLPYPMFSRLLLQYLLHLHRK